jgi:hypothetical protein
MGSLFATGAAKASGWFDSSRPKTTPFDKLEGRGAKMSAKQRAEFLAREGAKESSGNGLRANTPLSSRYA